MAELDFPAFKINRRDTLLGLLVGGIFAGVYLVRPEFTLGLPPSAFQIAGDLVSSIILFPGSEELFFRGIVDRQTEEWLLKLGIKNKLTAIVIAMIFTAFAFGLFHYYVYGEAIGANLLAFFAAFLFSILASAMVRSTGNLYPAVLAHALYNASILLGTRLAIA